MYLQGITKKNPENEGSDDISFTQKMLGEMRHNIKVKCTLCSVI